MICLKRTIGALILALCSSWAGAAEEENSIDPQVFNREAVYNFALKSLKPLRVQNLRGRIFVKAWAQEKIRVKALLQVETLPNGADAAFQAMDVTLRDRPGRWELLAVYGKGLPMRRKLEERKNPVASIDLEISAPGGLPLEIVQVGQPVEVEGWNGPIGIFGPEGQVFLRNIDTPLAEINCPGCSATISRFKGELKIMGGEGTVFLEEVSGRDLFVHTTGGSVSGRKLQTTGVFDLGGGNLKLTDVSGSVQFQTRSGSVELEGVSGSLSGRTETGSLSAFVENWKSSGRDFIESDTGPITLHVGKLEAMDFDVRPGLGTLDLDPIWNPVIKKTERKSENTLRVHSQSGAVKVLSWKPEKRG